MGRRPEKSVAIASAGLQGSKGWFEWLFCKVIPEIEIFRESGKGTQNSFIAPQVKTIACTTFLHSANW